MPEYEIRPYRPEDRDGFLSLYETVMGGTRSEKWFEWKYEENPYVDHVPMTVALHDGAVIGSRPLFALPMACDGETTVALQPGDAMVHPDHRRKGLFSRMMDRTIERYADRYPFYFSFPNDVSGSAHRKHGARIVAERPCYYRIDNPGAVTRARTDRSALRVLGDAVTPLVRGYHTLREYTASEPSVAIRTASDPPATLAALYRTAVPETLHLRREEPFYRWRLENPDWEYTTYVAGGETGPTAAIVAGTSVEPNPTTTRLTDVVPLASVPEPALAGLLGRIVADHPETDLFVAPPQGIDESPLRRFGFFPDTTFPLSYVTRRTTHVVRTLDGDWTHHGVDLVDPDSWCLTFIEDDTS